MIIIILTMIIQQIRQDNNYKDSLHPGTSVTLDFGFITILSPNRVGSGTIIIFTDILDKLGSNTWTAISDPYLRLNIVSRLGYRSVQLFQRGSFRRYIVSELYLGIVIHNFCHFVK